MPKDKVVVGIDVGSSKIGTIIATCPVDNPLNVIGVSSVASRGIKKGQVVDIEEAVSAISESIEQAERMAGYSVGSAFISVGGTHIECQNSKGVVAVSEPGGEITEDDLKRVIEAARAISLPSSREIIHVEPRYFTVDSQSGIKDPLGMTGVRLEVDTHIVTGAATSMRNLAKCVSEVGVSVEGLIFGGLASSIATLTETEKELGVILVDIGGGTTQISIWVEGALSHSAVLPIGAKNITGDLAIGLRVSLETAEKIKLHLSTPKKEPAEPEGVEDKEEREGETKKEKDEKIDFSHLGIEEEVAPISKKTLIDGIIRPRLKEIFTMVAGEVKKSGLGAVIPSGIVLTGGGGQTMGIAEVARHELMMPVRIAIPNGVSGLIDEIESPIFATAVGLILYGAHAEKEEARIPLVGRVEIKGLVQKGLGWLKSFLP